jgi:ubiquinone/menaquinone biosynthesis C-methylase UbiE
MSASSDLNPQAAQMADESMVRTLAAQAEAIWPQERPLFARYGLAAGAKILDAGCGTGEIASRLTELLPTAQVLGIDILQGPLDLAHAHAVRFGDRLRFELRSIFATGLPAGHFDLVTCRHVLQSVPHPERVLAELARVTRPGGHLHLIAEDYGMIHFPPSSEPGDFFPCAPREFGAATGTDSFIGRNVFGLLQALGLEAITVDYVVVDTLRVPRKTLAAIFTAWRDGYVDPIGQHTRFDHAQARAAFEAMIATIKDPHRYAVWLVPVVAARVPLAGLKPPAS